MEIDPGDVLGEARIAVQDKEYAKALEKYHWFFDNSIKIEQSYYGVRLSYCLEEWAELGEQYSPAWEALVKEKQKALFDFKNSHSFNSFHDYSSISNYLGQEREVFKEFLLIHESNKDIAKNIFTLVYEHCASNKLWEICREYLGNGYKQYKMALKLFDHTIKHAEERKNKGDNSYYLDSIELFKRESLWILNMLHSVNALEEYKFAISEIQSDLCERGYEHIFKTVQEKAPNPAIKGTSR